MSLDFGKLSFSTSFDRTAAFPLDAKSYFESLSAALEAAASAEVAGSSNTAYYFGQTVAVVDVANNNETKLYVIIPAAEGGTLRELGSGGGTSLNHFYVGYYNGNEFYPNDSYVAGTELPHDTEAFYLDVAGTNRFYKYIGDTTKYKKQDVQDVNIPTATDEVAGIMKLYQTHGQSTDGTMSQKTITDGVNSIKFAIETSDVDEDGDGNAENILVLDLPWD